MNSDLTLIILIIISCITSVLTIKLLKNKIIKKIINIIVYVIYIIVLILILQRIAFRDNRIFNYYIYKIASGSMKDTLQVNDYIIVRKSNNCFLSLTILKELKSWFSKKSFGRTVPVNEPVS